MEELQARGFVEAPRVDKPIGIYVLLREGKVVYVGQSRNVYTRLGQHYVSKAKTRSRSMHFAPSDPRGLPIKFDQVMMLFCEREKLNLLEAELIRRYKPKYNSQVGRTNLPDVEIDVVALAQEVGIQYNELDKKPVKIDVLAIMEEAGIELKQKKGYVPVVDTDALEELGTSLRVNGPYRRRVA